MRQQNNSLFYKASLDSPFCRAVSEGRSIQEAANAAGGGVPTMTVRFAMLNNTGGEVAIKGGESLNLVGQTTDNQVDSAATADSFMYDVREASASQFTDQNKVVYEKVTIQHKGDTCIAELYYEQNDFEFATDVTDGYTQFVVTGATGAFAGAKKVHIEYDNDGSEAWNTGGAGARRVTILH